MKKIFIPLSIVLVGITILTILEIAVHYKSSPQPQATMIVALTPAATTKQPKPAPATSPAKPTPQPSPQPQVTEPQPPFPTDSKMSVENMIMLHNWARYENKLPLFKVNDQLSTAAGLKLQDMILNNYFAHVSPSGKTLGDFAIEAGYDYVILGENLGYSGITAEGVDLGDGFKIFDAFMASPTHRANILSPSYKDIGVAVNGKYVVVYFGKKK